MKPRVVLHIQDLDVAPLKGDTLFEFTSDGTPEISRSDAAPQTMTAKALVSQTLAEYAATVFDPARRKEFYSAGVILEDIVDASRGISSTLQELKQPNNAEMVEPALRAVLKARAEITVYSPLAAQQLSWDKVEVRIAQMADLEQERERLMTRLENLVIRQAHTRQLVYTELDNMRKLLGPIYEAHRGLKKTLKPFGELFYGPSEQGIETKKLVKRAIDEANAKKADGKDDAGGHDRPAVEDTHPQKPAGPTAK